MVTTTTQSSNFFPYIGDFWAEVPDEEKEVILAYWSSVWDYVDKMYVNTYNAFLSKGIEYCPPVFESYDNYYELVFSGVNKNVTLVDGQYFFTIPGLISVSELAHNINEPTYTDNPNYVYYQNKDFSIQEGRGIVFSSGLTPRLDINNNSDIERKSTLYAKYEAKYNPVLFEFYGNTVGINSSEFKSRVYSASHITSGLTDKKYYEYPINYSGLLLHLRAEDGTRLEGSSYIWNSSSCSGNLYAYSSANNLPTRIKDSNNNYYYQFNSAGDTYFSLSETLLIEDYTVVTIAKHVDGRPYILGGDHASHLPMAANETSYTLSYGFNYSGVAGTIPIIGGSVNYTSVSDDVAVSVATRNTDGTGHRAYLDNSDVSGLNYHTTKNGTVNIQYVGKREDAPVTKFGGNLYELMLFDRAVSSEEISNLQKYAVKKYGVSPRDPAYDISVLGITTYYKALIEALCRAASKYPSITNILNGYNIIRGLPIALTAGTASITSNSATIGNYIYTINENSEWLISDGDIVNKFDILVSGTYLYDMVSNSGLIRSIFSGVSDFYNKFIVVDNVSGIGFNGTQISDFMNIIKPAGLEYYITTLSGATTYVYEGPGGKTDGTPILET